MSKIEQEKIVIYRFTPLSQEIAKVMVEKGYEVIIIEECEKTAQKAIDLNYRTMVLSLMIDDNIIKAGICDPHTKAFFCLDDKTNNNLFVTLSVRNLNKTIKIISLSSEDQTEQAMYLAGANKIINPYDIGAIRIARLLHKPLILKIIDNILFKQTDIDIIEITIKKGTIFDGIYLDDLKKIQNQDIVILGIQDKELSDKFIFFSTGINHKIDAGDVLVLLGHKKDLDIFKKDLNSLI